MAVYRDLTKGPILGNLIRLSWPGVAGRIFENLYDIIDLFWIGMLAVPLATQAQGSLIVFGVVFQALSFFNNLLGPGSVAILSRYWGERNFRKSVWVAEQTISYKFLFGLLAAALGLVFLPYLMKFTGASQIPVEGCAYSMYELGIQYGQIILLAVPFLFVFFTYNTIFRCTSEAETSMLLTALSAIINMVLDPLLIMGIGPFPELGFTGAAVATVISQMAAFVLGLYLLLTGKKIEVKRKTLLALPKVHDSFVTYRLRLPYFVIRTAKRGILVRFNGLFKLDVKILWNFMRIGFVPSISQMMHSGAGIIYMNLLGYYNMPALIPAFGITMRLTGLLNMPLLGLQQAAGALVGQNLGAKKPERSVKTVWLSVFIGLGMGVFMTLLTTIFASPIYGLFNSDPSVIALGSSIIPIIMIGNTLNAGQWMIWAAFDGSGYTLWPTVVGQSINWFGRILPILLVVKVFGLHYTWIFYFGVFASGLWFISNIILMQKSAWKSARID